MAEAEISTQDGQSVKDKLFEELAKGIQEVMDSEKFKLWCHTTGTFFLMVILFVMLC